MKIATDHGFPKASFGGSDPNAFDAFKSERDYIAQGGRMTSTTAAMDWAAGEIERLRAYIWSLDGKHICIRADNGATFIDDGIIVATDILGSAHEQSGDGGKDGQAR